MARDVKVKLNSRGVAALLKSPGVQDIVAAYARPIAVRAGPGMEVEAMVGRTRARASVVTTTREAMLAEAQDRRLSSALQAAA